MSTTLDGFGELSAPEFNALQLLGRALHVKEADLAATLHAILESATTVVTSADHAGLNLLIKGQFEPQATVGTAPPKLDALQKRTGTGPCIDASRDQVTIEIDDLTTDTRWPDFADNAVRLGVHAMLCVPLWVDERSLGSLSLYAVTPNAFDAATKRLADLYATHAALALAAAQRTDQLRRAMANRDVIGQAKGVLMERHRITADQAFDMLKDTSQKLNRKVVDVAESVAATGLLPGT